MTLLDWRHGHEALTQAPCHYCHEPTYLRETRTRPAHKVCAERDADDRAARAAANYRKDTL